MNDSTVFQLEDLPMEIFVEIYQYLSVHDLYFSFSHLNSRLNSIFKSLPNLNLIATSHLDPVLSFFKSFSTVQLHFDCSRSSILSQFNLSNFIGIQSFTIDLTVDSLDYIQPVEQLEEFLHPDLSPHLRFLRIPYCSKRLIRWIFTGAFPQLKACHLYHDRYSRIILSSLTNHRLPYLRQLTIHNCDGDDLETVLLMCPNLNYLEFSLDSVLPPFDHLNSPYLSLKRLRLFRIRSFLFHHNDQFDSLLSYFPNLIHFDLIADQCSVQDERLDLDKVAQYFNHRVPHLKVLNLRVYVTNRNRSSLVRHTFTQISQLHSLFKCLGRTGGFVHIASFDFTKTCFYDHKFVRPASE
jgi:hypothetical protein